ncbi:hypothetical protein MVEN_02452200 [Mycena venus]|uniref:Uncharacterized protein n=1 Tax=Mycena venus TaxID=2733690 RepID=A0A8H7CB28_9AGAR|nr:hypothetical protein MVEN_02452200 [Mycena venus]
MRAFAILSALAALSSAVAAPPAPSKASAYGDLTNGQRLARGLPLKAPARRTKAARDGAASPVPSYTAKGHLLVRNAEDNSVLGYASKRPTPVTFITKDLDNALTLSVTLPVGATGGSQLNLAQVDSPNAFTSFGLVQSVDSSNTDIPAGSFKRCLSALAATSTSPARMTPPLVRLPQQPGNLPSDRLGKTVSSESAVWTIDIVSGMAVPIWIGSDGVAATTQLFLQFDVLYAAGDVGTFRARFGDSVIPITLTWVPAV